MNPKVRSSKCKIRARGSRDLRLTAFLTPSTLPSPMAWESGWPLAEQSLSRTAGNFGLYLTYLKVPCSSSSCRLAATKLVKTWPAPSWMMAAGVELGRSSSKSRARPRRQSLTTRCWQLGCPIRVR
jgi:hypothetical protein